MICSQVFVILEFICFILQSILNFNEKYLRLTGFGWDIILCTSTISLMTEFKKYIFIFDFVTFLGFSKQFVLNFKKFTNFIPIFMNTICVFYLILVLIRAILAFISDPYYQIFHKFCDIIYITRSILC